MKYYIAIILTMTAWILQAQTEPVTLARCRELARENYPVLRQKEILQSLSGLKTANLGTSYLPQVELNGQATYQSDVTKVDIPVPGITLPELSKDHFKVYLDVKQTIWDGGITVARREVESALLGAGLKEVEVELFQLQARVDEAYFTSLILQQNRRQLEQTKETLQKRLSELESAFRNGVTEASNIDQLQAELLLVGQKIAEVETARTTALSVLSLLTATEITSSTSLELPQPAQAVQPSFVRPEFDLFTLKSEQLKKQESLLDKSRNPKLFGFGQAGYGRPGLNMLKNDFEPWYLVGVGVKWNVFDWKTTQREKQILQLQQSVIETRRAELELNLSILLSRQQKLIDQLKELIAGDQELVLLREKISRASAAKLEHGTITSSGYLLDLNAETAAKINLETRNLKLAEAILTYNTIKGF